MNNQEQNNDNLSIFNSLPGEDKTVEEQNKNINIEAQMNKSNQETKFVSSVQDKTTLQSNINNGITFNEGDPLIQPIGNMNSSTVSGQHINNKTSNVENLEKYNNMSNPKSYSDEELLRYFVGNNFDKVVSKRFNFSALFFGPFYFLYRKMYLLGIILIIVSAILSSVLNSTYMTGIIINILCGFSFNYLYLNFASKKIEKIKSQHFYDSINVMCIKKGGTSIALAILALIIYIVVMVFITPFMFLFTFIFSSDDVDSKMEAFDVNLSTYTVFCNEGFPECTVYYPYTETGENISCTLDNKKSTWHVTPGYVLADGSESCENFMSALYSNSNLADEFLPDSGEIILTSDGMMENGTTLTFGNKKCIYEKNGYSCK